MAELKAWLGSRPGCRGALMSGSGATIYGIFNSFAEAREGFDNSVRQWREKDCRVFLARNLRCRFRFPERGDK